jgi:hypothetical protein
VPISLVCIPGIIACRFFNMQWLLNLVAIGDYHSKSHFTAISEIHVEHCFLAFNFSFNRFPRASFTQALQRRGIGPAGVEFGKPAFSMFCSPGFNRRVRFATKLQQRATCSPVN